MKKVILMVFIVLGMMACEKETIVTNTVGGTELKSEITTSVEVVSFQNELIPLAKWALAGELCTATGLKVWVYNKPYYDGHEVVNSIHFWVCDDNGNFMSVLPEDLIHIKSLTIN